MKFEELIESINSVHSELQQKAVSAINKYLTIRNWLIGFYIVEFEQNGEDRAKYGDKLIIKISSELKDKIFSERSLRLFRQFYLTYPNIINSIDNIQQNLSLEIRQSVIAKLKNNNEKLMGVSFEVLLTRLSFTHIVELIKLDDELKRSFYEVECIKGNWSVRELQRQINSLYFERMGLSQDKNKLSEYTQNKVIKLEAKDIIQSPFFFEFLDLKEKNVIKENDIEDALMDKLQDFILELGHGFCFEARQKRITIGDEHFFADLVFYHRILKCHILIELKLDKFNHENMGQLNTYLNYYKKNIMVEGDNPPIGILLCSDKNQALVEYATMGIDNQLFVSKYQLALPTKEQLQDFINNEIKNIE